jgi:hypothetical protein
LSAIQSTQTDIKLALNDLPTLYSNLVQDVNIVDNGDNKVIKITFSSQLGKNILILSQLPVLTILLD